MSYFHKIPKKEILREEAISKADQYFESKELNISSLSLLTIILPSKKPLKGFPRQNPLLLISKAIGSEIKRGCSDSLFSEDCFLVCCALSIFPCAICCNIGLLIETRYELSVMERLDLVRGVILIYTEGVFVYRRRLEAFRCPLFCFCAAAIGDEDRDYEDHEEEVFFVEWKDIAIPEKLNRDIPGFYCQDFVYFPIGVHRVATRREVFDTLKKHKKEYIFKNKV
eukprot:snap_masked-scaffold_56-processed-gene-0.26-mRNA-1 protein AED:1.00 eAED:1.00 QI:0/-1/0/0/-1/1/1/0/224